MARRMPLRRYGGTPAGSSRVRPQESGPQPASNGVFLKTVKPVGITALVFGAVLALVFVAAYRHEPESVYAGAIGSFVLGSMLGMFIGLMAFLYPHRQVIVPMATMMFFGIVLWVAAFLKRTGEGMSRENYLALIGLLFVTSCLGYGIGYWVYQRAVRERWKFQTRQRAHFETDDQELP